MRLTPSLIAIRRIESASLRSSFEPEALDEAARLILQSGGLVEPLIVNRQGLESFSLQAGEFAFQAAVRAKELDPLKGEMVLAFVEEEGGEGHLLRQVELMARYSAGAPKLERTLDVSAFLKNNERRLEQLFGDLGERIARENAATKEALSVLSERLPRPLDALTQFNQAEGPILCDLLRLGGMPAKRAERIGREILEARSEGAFRSLKDCSERIKGLSCEGVLKLVDAWSRVSLNPE